MLANLKFSPKVVEGGLGEESFKGRQGQLGLEFFKRSAVEVAKDLVGMKISRVVDGVTIAGIITETQAYPGGNDPDTHKYRGKDNVSWSEGKLYIYSTQGHSIMTLTAQSVQDGGCVLIREMKIIEGLGDIKARGITVDKDQKVVGPAKVAKCLGLSTDRNGWFPREAGVSLEWGPPVPESQIGASKRLNSRSDDKFRFTLK